MRRCGNGGRTLGGAGQFRLRSERLEKLVPTCNGQHKYAQGGRTKRAGSRCAVMENQPGGPNLTPRILNPPPSASWVRVCEATASFLTTCLPTDKRRQAQKIYPLTVCRLLPQICAHLRHLQTNVSPSVTSVLSCLNRIDHPVDPFQSCNPVTRSCAIKSKNNQFCNTRMEDSPYFD
jgi:hypothetical protein